MYAVIIVGTLMMVYVTFGGMIATTWVQIIKACPEACNMQHQQMYIYQDCEAVQQ